jgi:hypothetical protein
MPASTTVTFHLPHSSLEPLELSVKMPSLAMAVVPRDAVSALDEKWAKAIGVYVLLGPSDDEHDYRAYVGQSGTGGLKERLTTHRNSPSWKQRHGLEKDWWARALIVRSRDEDGFNSAEAGWLEGRLWDILNSAPKAELVGKKGDDQTLPQHERERLEQYLPPITAVLRAIGASPDTPDQEPKPRKVKKHAATVTDLIQAGAISAGARLRSISSLHEAIAVVRADGQLEVEGALYDSPSGAAVAVVGHEMNGWTFWGFQSGAGTLVTLAELRKQLEPAPSEPEPAADGEVESTGGEEGAGGESSTKSQVGGLKALLDAGSLASGATIHADYKGRRYTATVDEEGCLRLEDGSVHKNPSGAAVKVTGYETNGWRFWRAEVKGKTVPLGDLRR